MLKMSDYGAEDYCGISDEEFYRFKYVPIPTYQILQQEKGQQNGNDLTAKPIDFSSSASFDTNGDGNGTSSSNENSPTVLASLKIEALEAKNQMLEEKLKNSQLKTEIHALKLKEGNIKNEIQTREDEQNKEFQSKLEELKVEFAAKLSIQNAQMEELKRAILDSQKVQKESSGNLKKGFEEEQQKVTGSSILSETTLSHLNAIIESSSLLIAGRQYNIPPNRKIELNDQFIIMPIAMGTETLLVSLAFKHISGVQLYDNGDIGGLILHMDDFMAGKLQNILADGDGDVIANSTDKFIVVDILNCDPESLSEIRKILRNAGRFNQEYINRQHAQTYLSTISDVEWNAKLGIHKPRLNNPLQNGWKASSTTAKIAPNGLNVVVDASSRNANEWVNVVAEQGFPTTREHCLQMQNGSLPDASGPIVSYFEIIQTSPSSNKWGRFDIGLSPASAANSIVDGSFYDWLRKSYSIPTGYNYCRLDGKRHDFELPERKGIKLKSESEWKGREDVYGCGLLLDTKNKCFIFFTKNGTLMGKQMAISPWEKLYPTVSTSILGNFEANFGDDSAKPFKYDIGKCPGLKWDSINRLKTRENTAKDDDINSSITETNMAEQMDIFEKCQQKKFIGNWCFGREDKDNEHGKLLDQAAFQALCLLYNRAHYKVSVVPRVLDELAMRTAEIDSEWTLMIDAITESLNSQLEAVAKFRMLQPADEKKLSPCNGDKEWDNGVDDSYGGYERAKLEFGEALERMNFRNQCRMEELKMRHLLVYKHISNMKFQKEYLVDSLNKRLEPPNFDTVLSEELLVQLEDRFHSWGKEKIRKKMQSLMESWSRVFPIWNVKYAECKSAISAFQKYLDKNYDALTNWHSTSNQSDASISNGTCIGNGCDFGSQKAPKKKYSPVLTCAQVDQISMDGDSIKNALRWRKEEEEEKKKEELYKKFREKYMPILNNQENWPTDDDGWPPSLDDDWKGKSKVPAKVKQFAKPIGNSWSDANKEVTISQHGLNAYAQDSNTRGQNVFAKEGFDISGIQRTDHFLAPIIYYYEVAVTLASSWSESCGYDVGLSDGAIPDKSFPGEYPNSYAIMNYDTYCYLSGEEHKFALSPDAIKPKWRGREDGNVIGCGLLLSQRNQLAIFFTLNGRIMGKQISIRPSVPKLYPTVCLYHMSVEANFGDNLTRPFQYDIDKCPGLVL